MSKESDKNTKLSFLQSVFVGSALGVTGYTINMPFWTAKTRIQAGAPFTLNPFVLFRGLTSILATMAPITTIQIAFTSAIERVMDAETTVSSQQRMLTSFLGGASAAPFSNALTMIIVQQHKQENASFLATAKSTYTKYGLSRFTAGLPAQMVADGLYVFSFYALASWLRMNLYSEEQSQSLNAKITSGLMAGLVSVLTTQLPDRIKTYQQLQANASNRIPTILESAKTLCRAEGFRGFFCKGLGPRLIGGPVTIMATSMVSDSLNQYFNNTPKAR